MRYASFFSGAGGFDLGLEQAGWTCAFANEWDKVACRTLRANRPDLALFEGDIRGISVDDVPSGPYDAVVGGPPCQAFSTAGRRLGLDDERGNVFLHFLDLAIALKPRLIVIENVRGLVSAPLRHRPHAERGFDHPPLEPSEMPGGALAHLLSVLHGAGYQTTTQLVDSADFGVPQHRLRLVILASTSGSRLGLTPTHGANRSHPWTTFAEAVKGLNERPEATALRSNQIGPLKQLGPGQNWRDLPADVARAAMGKAFDCTGGRTGFLRRLAWDEPAPTLVTSPTMPATLLAHPVDLRPLSVQEYRRIQGFPDSWLVAGTTAQKYRQIGNAVPVRLAREIGLQLGRAVAPAA